MTPANDSGTKAAILDAARRCLLADGFHAISTRKIAAAAGVPLSQVHYHFGSKGGMMLALLEAENRRRLRRQTSMYAEDAPLWQRYEQACDFLDEDIESGYVRVLQEMIAAGWSTPEISDKVRATLQGWYDLLTDVATEAAERFGGLGPFTPVEVATLIGCSFIGAESLLLVGFQRQQLPIRAALRRVSQLIRAAEEPVAVSAGERRRGEG